MNALELIGEVERVGGQLSANGDKLRYRLPPGEAKRLVPLLAEHKKQVLEALKVQRATRHQQAPQLEGLAECGSPSCNGCYSIGDGRKIHPPRTSQKYLDWLRRWEPTGEPRQ